MIIATVVAGGVALSAAYLLVCLAPVHLRWTGDVQSAGPQKFHTEVTPRVGGVAILCGAAAGGTDLALRGYIPDGDIFMLALACLPVFLGGLAEDVTHRVSPRSRLLLSFLAAGIAFFLLGAELRRLEIPPFDALLEWTPIALVVTVFCIGGVSHAFNIIDGFNGLSTMVSIIVAVALAVVAHQVGDQYVMLISIVLVGTMIGFLVMNYPSGRLFAGDSGAYLMGFLVAVLSVLLVARNAEVSAWFPLLLIIYPVWETLFSVYRKKYLRGQSPDQPDGVHLHMLVYKRLVRCSYASRGPAAKPTRNARTSPYLWALTSLCAAPAVLFYDNTLMLLGFALLFVILYCRLYWSIVQFQTPKWLILQLRNRRRKVRQSSY